ncbi:MAG: terminase, partial [Alteromonadales bacterium]|nr:terminase [Alteromonadales bacterium]
ENIESLTYEQMAEAMTYKWFRLNSLYHIKNKQGQKTLFTPNKEQEAFYCQQHNRDIILKARQLGFTTFKMISDLDDCLFIENFSAGCICHNMDSAKDIFRNKIKFAYNNITDEQKKIISELGYQLPAPTSDKGNAYVFSNGSAIKVGTSYRGDTLQSLHVSEFGKICKKYPDKAQEIVTGAFEAVPADGGIITLESTAEGKEGYFYKYCQQAKKQKDLGKKLSVLDFSFHFFSWW